tara:strand:- start:3269 stop:5662 length:2394 start_codon:yes stop_codon:yes gene_type:complete
MRKVQLYINNQLVDLFNDEKIQITSSIQNISDISKTFTDFSMPFTLPASDNNNAVFDFFYNNDVNNATFVAKERADARIEINNIPFRKGKVQLEGSEIKRNEADSYRVTFYGDIVSLKDLFGENELSDLDYSSIAFDYTGVNVKDTITNSSSLLNVRFPLISSNRVWQYGDGTSSDISIDAGAINFTELFPAVKDAKLMEIIAAEYGLTFDSIFLNGNYFANSFTLWKNLKEPAFTTTPYLIQFAGDGSTAGNYLFPSNQVRINSFNQAALDTSGAVGVAFSSFNRIVSVKSTISALGGGAVPFFLDVYRDGVLLTTISATTGASSSVDIPVVPITSDSQSLDEYYTFEVRMVTASATSILGGITINRSYNVFSGGSVSTVVQAFTATIGTQALPTTYNFKTTAPKIKVADWFSGILKQFNLTCYPLEAEKTYQIEPLEQWYNFGGEINITPYTDIESIKIDRPKLYKEVSFEYEKSKAFLNENFEGTNARRYGNLNLTMPYDGKDFKVKLPFENMLFTKFTGTDLQVSYAIDNAVGGNSYIPKPVKLFMDQSKTVSFKLYVLPNSGGVINTVTSYMPFGQDQFYNQENNSQNFGYDISSLKNIPISNSLYQNFYQAYIVNLFNPKTRIVTLKCHLPLPMLTLLTLDDAVILRDKKYRINSMKTDLTSGEVELVLINDFTETTGNIVGPKSSIVGASNEISFPIKMLKPPNPTKSFGGGGGYIVLSATLETSFITLSIKGGAVSLPLTLTSDTQLDITYARNVSGSDRIQSIPYTYYDATGTAISDVKYLTVTQLAL